MTAPKIALLKPQSRKKNDPARILARRLLKRPEHLKTLKKKLDDGSLHPSIQVALMYYAWGKPKETIEATHIVPVKIVHQYNTEDPAIPSAVPSAIPDDLAEASPATILEDLQSAPED